jgi:hypothetical protein
MTRALSLYSLYGRGLEAKLSVMRALNLLRRGLSSLMEHDVTTGNGKRLMNLGIK